MHSIMGTSWLAPVHSPLGSLESQVWWGCSAVGTRKNLSQSKTPERNIAQIQGPQHQLLWSTGAHLLFWCQRSQVRHSQIPFFFLKIMHSSTSYLTKYISWAGLNVSLGYIQIANGTFKLKKMMSYSDCLCTEGSQYSQRRVRCNPGQPSQAAAMWLLISLFWLPAKSGYSSPDRCSLVINWI